MPQTSCPECRSPNDPQAVYCGRCGHKFPSQEPAAPPTKSGGGGAGWLILIVLGLVAWVGYLFLPGPQRSSSSASSAVPLEAMTQMNQSYVLDAEKGSAVRRLLEPELRLEQFRNRLRIRGTPDEIVRVDHFIRYLEDHGKGRTKGERVKTEKYYLPSHKAKAFLDVIRVTGATAISVHPHGNGFMVDATQDAHTILRDFFHIID